MPELCQKQVGGFRGQEVTVGGYTFVVVNGAEWRFDREGVFGAMRRGHIGQPLERRGRRLARVGYSDAWDVGLSDDLTAFVISAPPAPMIDLAERLGSTKPPKVP